MTSDAFYAIGKAHAVCQDYALARGNLACIADGCSSSPDTDMGARLLCWTAVTHYPFIADFDGVAVLRGLGLSPNAMDATLLTVAPLPTAGDVLTVDDAPHRVEAGGFGDGILLARRRQDRTWIVRSIDFPSGAPFYGNYLNDERRMAQYRQRFSTLRRITTYDTRDGSEQVEERTDEPIAHFFTFDLREFDIVMVGSDGWLSGQRPVASSTSRTYESVPLLEVAAEMTAFKIMAGTFVQRRIRRMLEDWHAKGWFFSDDVSLAAIYAAEPPEDTP